MLREDTNSIEEHKKMYRQYANAQLDAILPRVSDITIEEAEERNTEVHMDASYKDVNYHFESVKEKDAQDFYDYLNSQPIVREKYANGNPLTIEATKARTMQFSGRFNPKTTDGLYLYSGFVVSDNDTGDFLGIANLGGSGKDDGHAEMAFLNRADAWSSATPEIVEEYVLPAEKSKLKSSYNGVGTAEVCSLLQYAALLKEKGYLIQAKELEGVNATARVDNPGSWKACAKAGMDVVDIDCNPSYGPALRYQLKKRL
jgi:hypothetical protein